MLPQAAAAARLDRVKCGRQVAANSAKLPDAQSITRK
jgi:hypothetical protein